jgi:hypothetical protein
VKAWQSAPVACWSRVLHRHFEEVSGCSAGTFRRSGIYFNIQRELCGGSNCLLHLGGKHE